MWTTGFPTSTTLASVGLGMDMWWGMTSTSVGNTCTNGGSGWDGSGSTGDASGAGSTGTQWAFNQITVSCSQTLLNVLCACGTSSPPATTQSPTPAPGSLYIFETYHTTNGSFGGRVGGDAFCAIDKPTASGLVCDYIFALVGIPDETLNNGGMPPTLPPLMQPIGLSTPIYVVSPVQSPTPNVVTALSVTWQHLWPINVGSGFPSGHSLSSYGFVGTYFWSALSLLRLRFWQPYKTTCSSWQPSGLNQGGVYSGLTGTGANWVVDTSPG